jgi:hypothetical protein
MTYILRVFENNNDLDDVFVFVQDQPDGYHQGAGGDDNNRWFEISFEDKRYATMFKLQFNAEVVLWDESNNKTIVTEAGLVATGYFQASLQVSQDKSQEFEAWCDANDIAVVEEIKLLSNNIEPYNIWVPNQALLDQARAMWAT